MASTEFDKLLAGLPPEVVNELAILEDRALRSEQATAQLTTRLEECRAEIAALRDVVTELTNLGQEISTRAQAIVTEAQAQVEAAEGALRRALVLASG